MSYVTLRWLSKKCIERERSKIDKDIPASAATRAVNLPHAQPATEGREVLQAKLKLSESRHRSCAQ